MKEEGNWVDTPFGRSYRWVRGGVCLVVQRWRARESGGSWTTHFEERDFYTAEVWLFAGQERSGEPQQGQQGLRVLRLDSSERLTKLYGAKARLDAVMRRLAGGAGGAEPTGEAEVVGEPVSEEQEKSDGEQ